MQVRKVASETGQDMADETGSVASSDLAALMCDQMDQEFITEQSQTQNTQERLKGVEHEATKDASEAIATAEFGAISDTDEEALLDKLEEMMK
jgi:hypothetical protein